MAKINSDETIIEQRQNRDAGLTEQGRYHDGMVMEKRQINADETIIDGQLSGDEMYIEQSRLRSGINASETVLDSAAMPENAVRSNIGRNVSDPISEGAMLGGFQIVKLISSGAQAKVYLVERDGKQYAAKLYGRDWQPVKAIRLFFLNHPHENVMRVIDSGRELSRYYEIYPYYEQGTLEDYVRENGTLSVEFIRRYVVPCVNEGLHHLHSNHIVHCDIKPSNLYLEKFGEDFRVVIGDLGSCRVMDSDGLVRASLEGTVNYSVPVEDFYGVKTFPKEYDYASFGITLYRLYTDTHLMDGLDLNERARLWERNTVIPVDDVRLKALLSGLINKEFALVWGYDELKRWSDRGWNSDKKRKPLREKSRKTAPLIFGTVDGQIVRVNSIHELAVQCRDNWELAKTVLKRYDTLQFIRQCDVELYQRVERELSCRNQNENITLFRIIYMLEKTNKICYKGEELGTLNEFLVKLSKGDDTAIEFVTFDLLTYYMEMMGASQDDIDKLDELVKLNRLNALSTSTMIDGICRVFMRNQTLRLEGWDIDSMDVFVDYITEKTPYEIELLLARDDVRAWFISMGYSKEMEKLR